MGNIPPCKGNFLFPFQMLAVTPEHCRQTSQLPRSSCVPPSTPSWTKMDVNYNQESSARFAFTQPAPPSIPQSPVSSSSRHSHTMSSESATSLFHHDVSTPLNFTAEASVGYSHPTSAVHSPMTMSTFPPTSTSPFVDGTARHRGSSFTSPPITSPSRSGFETPITPSESLHGRTNAASHNPEPTPGISFSTSDLVTMSVLEG